MITQLILALLIIVTLGATIYSLATYPYEIIRAVEGHRYARPHEKAESTQFIRKQSILCVLWILWPLGVCYLLFQIFRPSATLYTGLREYLEALKGTPKP